MPEPEPVPLYDEYLNERTEAEVETIKTLEAEPVLEMPGNTGNPDSLHSDDPPVPDPEETLGPIHPAPVNEDGNSSPTIAGDPDSPAAAVESEEEETSEEFRAQLASVQKQLEALSSLPNTIQLTIAALTEQLSALAQPKRKSKSRTPRPEGIRIFVFFLLLYKLI